MNTLFKNSFDNENYCPSPLEHLDTWKSTEESLFASQFDLEQALFQDYFAQFSSSSHRKSSFSVGS